MLEAIKNHWPEYLIEAWGLGTFMVSACAFGVLLFNPNSPLVSLNPMIRTVFMGVAMGTTAIGIICSPWGKRSGAHINPSVTIVFWRLGKVKGWDALFYILAQFLGAGAGVLLAWLVLGELLADSTVNFVVTVPGNDGVGVAFFAEVIISFFMMMMVLVCSNAVKLSRLTPFFAGMLVAIYISLESPISGMSMNPARSFGSAIVANHWNSIWIYFVAPPLAMLLAAEVYVRVKGLKEVYCAKFYHYGKMRCIFNCRFGEIGKSSSKFQISSSRLVDL